MNEFQFEFLDEVDKSEIKDILRNLNNIFRLSEGTVPLIRSLGLSIDNVSKIPVDLENDIATDIVAKVEINAIFFHRNGVGGGSIGVVK